MFNDFYVDRKVLVTGAAGVKGSWLCWYLLEAGAEVVGVDCCAQPHGVFEATGLDERIQRHVLDVRDATALRELMAGEHIEAGVHLAAVAIVAEAHARPLRAYSVNVAGTAGFLEAFRQSAAERAVVITTDKVYAPKGGRPWVEDDPLFASGPYAVSKACADAIARDYAASYLAPAGKSLAVARAGNVLAGGDFHEGRIFVDIAQALGRGEEPVILNPAFTRPYTWVGDVVAGYLWLLAKADADGIRGQALNFGPLEPEGIPNGDLATKMCELWGGAKSWRRGRPRDEPFELQSLDCGRALDRLGWQAAYTLDDALRELVAWYKAYFAGQHMRDLTLDMVRRHVLAARDRGLAWAE
ncbi:MAG: NAD-dependent epimerase/dehydratase family protein [Armatimonadota bacterium]